MAELRRLWDEDARRRLEALVTDDVRNWCRPEPVLAFGKAYQQILNAAETMHADLIVMGVHGRNPIDMMLFGSTTQHVVRKASCPVLTLRS
jgi:nucleotide-binding universal stress UspA family protein